MNDRVNNMLLSIQEFFPRKKIILTNYTYRSLKFGVNFES